MGSSSQEPPPQPKIFRPWLKPQDSNAKPQAVDWWGFENQWTLAAELNTMQPRSKQRPKKFLCPHCKVGFSNNGQLKGHIRIHTGERPYRCEAEGCGKRFTRNEELTRHKRIHSGLRPYPCGACGKRFGRKDHLKKHARTHIPQPVQFAPFLLYPYVVAY